MVEIKAARQSSVEPGKNDKRFRRLDSIAGIPQVEDPAFDNSLRPTSVLRSRP